MSAAIADKEMAEMYGEKMDASEADDFWPFVSINLTSPAHLHTQKE